VTISVTQPPYPMTLRVAVSDNVMEAITGRLNGHIYLHGIDARNNAITEVIDMTSANYVGKIDRETKLAFSRLDFVSFSSTFTGSVSANDTIGIGLGRKVGLSNPINDWTNVYKINSVTTNYGVVAYPTANAWPINFVVTSKNVNPSGDWYTELGSPIPISVFVPTLTGVESSTSLNYTYDLWYRQSD